mgnify:CR=1 FL=1
MAKMCVGRQGNHFPLFISQFVRPNIREVATRENVIREMAQVEAISGRGQMGRPHIARALYERACDGGLAEACLSLAGLGFQAFTSTTTRPRTLPCRI